MKRNFNLILICAAGLITLAASGGSFAKEPAKVEQKPLFASTALFKKIRIPKITVGTDGSVLAFANACSNYRRSTDGGKTWSITTKLKTSGGSVIADQTDGDIMIVCPKKSFLLRSRDNGSTWKRENIVVKSNVAGHGDPKGVPTLVNCSESGITLQFGKHKGRLLMPARIQPPNGDNAQEYWPYNYNAAIFSDDKGKTWQTSNPVQSGTGEGTLAEVSDGRVYYNSRSHMSVDHRRRIAWSHDGGNMWTDWEVSMDLFEVGEPFYYKYGSKPSYGCNAGLVRLPDEVTGGKDVLLFSTLDNPGGDREKITVWASFDRAKTWPVKRLVYKGPSGYSSLAADNNGTIFLLYENGKKKPYEQVSVARFNLEWLTQGKDWRKHLED